MAYAIMLRKPDICVVTDEFSRTSAALGADIGYFVAGVQKAGGVYVLPLLLQKNEYPWHYVRSRLEGQEESDTVYYHYLRATGNWKDAVEFGGKEIMLLDTFFYEQNGTVEELFQFIHPRISFRDIQEKPEAAIIQDIEPGLYNAYLGGKWYFVGTWSRASEVERLIDDIAEPVFISNILSVFSAPINLAGPEFTQNPDVAKKILNGILKTLKR